jgi:hypothetical protein
MENATVRRFLVAISLVSVLAGMSAVAGQSTGRAITFKVRLIQEATYRKVEPPDGNAGDIFSNTLRLFADGTVLGFKDGTPMGTMAYAWWFTGAFSCSSAAVGCKGTTNVRTVTKLPGGTMTAGADHVFFGVHGEIIPIQSGTGIFKGVTGTVTIAPAGVAEDVFNLVLPASS